MDSVKNFKLIEIIGSQLYVDSEEFGRLPRTELETPMRFVINFLGINNTQNLPVKIFINGEDKTLECRSYIRRELSEIKNLPTSVIDDINLRMRRTIPYVET